MADATALERAHLTIRGVRAELILEDGQLTLSKDGPPSTNLSFAVDQVRGTVLDPGSRGGRGWIHVAVVGGTLAPPGELAAMSDPYTIPLTSRSAVTARRLARIVEKHLHERGLPSEPTFAASALERGRFSSGVALTQAPGAARSAVDLQIDGGGPPASPSRNGSSPDTGRSAPSDATSSGSVRPQDREDADPRAVRIAAAEAALDQRAALDERSATGRHAATDDLAATEIGPLDPSSEPDVDGAAIEPAGAPVGWVEPTGPSPDEATDPSPSPASGSSRAPSPTSAPAPASAPVPVPAPAPASGPAPVSSPQPTAPPPTAPPALAPPTVVGRDLATELRQLGELFASGVLTDAEFEQAKARVLR